MKNLSPFQLILMVVSGIVIIAGVLMFAFSKASEGVAAGNVTIWGTMTNESFTLVANYLTDAKEIPQKIEYRYIKPEEFDTILTTALAEGGGPDIVMITDDKFVRHENKLLQIQYEFYNDRLYQDTFVEAGEIFKDTNGIFAFPFLVDPLVMYWNRSMFTQSGISQPPRLWTDLIPMVPRLTEKDERGNIQKSAVAIGEYQNVDHAKELYLTLLMQAGNNVAVKNTFDEDGEELEVPDYIVTFDDSLNFSLPPAIAATNFYTQFANPSRSVYTWNRSRSDSRDAFIAGDTAMYFGFSSEFATIRQQNPNLNFDVAIIPQSPTGNQKTYGRTLALGMPKSSANVQRAFPLIMTMTEPDVIKMISDALFMPPVRRDLLARPAENAFMQTFHDSALLANNIFDFNPEESNEIFKDIIENVVTGRFDASEAVNQANDKLDLLVPEN